MLEFCDFRERTVIVTGAAQGIGRGVCEGFAQAGATVVMVDIEVEPLEAAAREIGGIAAPADVSDSSQVEGVVKSALDQTGRIDVLFNNAGLLRDRMCWKTSDEEWEAVLGVSLGGTFRFTRACVPQFREQGAGRIINVTSYTGLHGNMGQSAYAAAKAGVIGYTKTTAKELARFGVTVNAISPNARTRMIDAIPEELRRAFESAIPLGRVGSPDDIAAAVMFLASPGGAYITGAVLPVDGGIAM